MAMVLAQRRVQAACGVQEQEQRAAIAHGGFQPGEGADRDAETRHAGRDENGVGQRAGKADHEHMFFAQALAQHEGVLRPDRHDQAQAEQEAGDEGGGHAEKTG
ncbi:hypothetical protein D3C72_1927690 [compost metagenome]